MIDFIYQTLAKFGYTHPLHPILIHVPVGMVIGAFLFALTSRIFHSANLAQTARHCIILALIVLLPATLLGIMDWQHFYGGAMLFPIKVKIVLAGLLLVFLILAVVFGRLQEASSRRVFALYLFCLLSAVGLGYFGGELVYGTKPSEKNILEGLAAEGAAVFQQDCSACHFADSAVNKIGPGLKGIFKRDKFSVSGQTVTEENFRKQLITPFDKMPPFGYLTEDQMAALAAYIKTL
jgi:mono/diheme cytochrome c family protein